MGARLNRDELRISLTPTPTPISAIDLDIPSDISSAAFWLVAAAIHPQARITVKNSGINPTRSGIIQVLRDMGAKLRVHGERMVGGEPVAELSAESSALVGTEVGGSIIPSLIDEVPLIAVAGCAARGTTVIRDAGELRVKESDRIAATVKELSRLGADIEELPDGMVIHGGRKLQGGECCSHHDHRLAMALGVAALTARRETVIQDAEAVAVSYPAFWQELSRLCSKI